MVKNTRGRRASASTAAQLRTLERIKGDFGGEASARKRELVERLARARLDGSAQVLRLHEALIFLRAYPDDVDLMRAVESALRRFAERPDLEAARAALADSGIAGTDIRYRFYWPTALWLATHWPHLLHIDWTDFDHRDWVTQLLPVLMPYTETLAFDEVEREPEEWIDALKARSETDAAFLVRRVAKLEASSLGREALYDTLDVPLCLRPGPDTPARTSARFAAAPFAYQTRALDRVRPDLRREVPVPPRALRKLPPPEGQRLIDLTRGAMVTRSRDLDAFCHADPRDVRIADCGDGLCFALMGIVPERRLMLESCYGVLTIKNGVPIGYVLISALFGSAAIAYNVFDTFRGGEAAKVFGRALALTHAVFGADAFSIDPYQLGDGNDEGLHSGAWWFYQKLGFQPADPGIRKLMQRELARMRVRPSHRSSLPTMRALVGGYMFFHLGVPRRDVVGRVDLGRIGTRASEVLSKRFGADRETAIRTCTQEAMRLLGVRSSRGWTAGERLWFERWSPLLLAVPGIDTWSAAERRAAVAVVRAKGGRPESAFVRLLDGHAKLRAGLLSLTR
ncbi:MAG: hypothetical protein R3F56_01020 [Planctomycetota bacterium]